MSVRNRLDVESSGEAFGAQESLVLVLGSQPSQAAETAHALEVHGIPAICTSSREMALSWISRTTVSVAVVSLEVPWWISFAGTLRRRGIAAIGISDDEVAQMRALRCGFVEVLSSTLSPQAIHLAVRVLLERSRAATLQHVDDDTAPLAIDRARRVVRWSDRNVHLTVGEFELLEYLAGRHDTIVPKLELMHEFGWEADNSLHQAIWQLRQAIGHEAGSHIVNSRGFGYGYLSDLGQASSQKETLIG